MTSAQDMVRCFGCRGYVDRIEELRSLNLIPDGMPLEEINKLIIHYQITQVESRKFLESKTHKGEK